MTRNRVRILFVPACGIVELNQLEPKDTLLRCQEALELWRTGEYDIIFCTGGIFLPPKKQTEPASKLMRDWFVSNSEGDVAEKDVLIETQSVDSYENIKFMLAVLAEKDITEPEITICSQWAHSIRLAMTLMLGYEVPQVDCRFLRYPMSLNMWLTEVGANVLHFIDPKGENFIARRSRNNRIASTKG